MGEAIKLRREENGEQTRRDREALAEGEGEDGGRKEADSLPSLLLPYKYPTEK